MKKTNIIILLVLAIVLVGGLIYINQTGDSSLEQPQNGQQKSYTLEESQELAESWIKNESPTFTYDGQDLVLKNSETLDKQACGDCYKFEFTFKSTHGGFGDREGKMVTQVITPHIINITVKEGEVTQAVTDNQFDELTEEIKQNGQKINKLHPQTTKLFYYNKEKDRNEQGEIECHPDAVQPVERVIPGEEPIKESIELLLEGKIREEEKEQGFQTEFPNPEFKLQKVDFEENSGELKLTFNKVPGFTSGGSCRVGLLQAQIEKTAAQFPEVENVTIEPETLFQP